MIEGQLSDGFEHAAREDRINRYLRGFPLLCDANIASRKTQNGLARLVHVDSPEKDAGCLFVTSHTALADYISTRSESAAPLTHQQIAQEYTKQVWWECESLAAVEKNPVSNDVHVSYAEHTFLVPLNALLFSEASNILQTTTFSWIREQLNSRITSCLQHSQPVNTNVPLHISISTFAGAQSHLFEYILERIFPRGNQRWRTQNIEWLNSDSFSKQNFAIGDWKGELIF